MTVKKSTIIQIIVIICLLITTVIGCVHVIVHEDVKDPTDVEKLVENHKSILDKLEKERIIERDSLNREIKTRNSIISLLEKVNIKKDKEIQEIEKTPVNIPVALEDHSNYYNKRYNTDENVNDDTQVLLQKNTSDKVINDLEVGEKNKKIIEIKNEQLNLQKEIITSLEDNLDDQELMNKSLEKEVKQRMFYEEALVANVEELNEDLRKQKRKTILNKILIPVGIVAGFVGGALLMK